MLQSFIFLPVSFINTFIICSALLFVSSVLPTLFPSPPAFVESEIRSRAEAAPSNPGAQPKPQAFLTFIII